MKPLSPKKYIETKVRSLPIYKCLVNKDWQEAGLANVIIMRRHVNGHVSGGVYLVDLKCLGIKDTMWFFNEDEDDMMEKFGGRDLPFETVDYALTHNIVFAGHDFAMEYDIHPEKEFATSRFVLEEDTDEIPLIDIETGENGMPHLIVYEAGQHLEALAKLQKNAGKGNYHYTIMVGKGGSIDEENDFDEDDENEEDEAPELRLTEIADGGLDLLNIRDVYIEDLLNENLVISRNKMEQLLCKAELMIRSFNLITDAEEDDTLVIDKEWETLESSAEFAGGMDEETYIEAMQQIGDSSGDLMVFGPGNPEIYRIKEKYLQSNQTNPLFICLMLEYELMSRDEDTRALIQQYIQPLSATPIIQLLLALESLLIDDNNEEWQPIIRAANATVAIPQLQQWGETELLYFWAIQIVCRAREDKLPEALAYYDLFTEIDDALLHLPLVMVIYEMLLPPLEQAILKDVKQMAPTEEESDED